MPQMLRRSESHFRHNVVAYLALFFALGGTARAAKPRITGADVQNDSLTGADLLESSLGKVPSAESADNVANADELDGIDSSRLARFGGLVASNGFVLQGSGGFTVHHVDGSGAYRISFAPGTFSGCYRPIATATPLSAGGNAFVAMVAHYECHADGSASFEVETKVVDTSSGQVDFADQTFNFVAM